MSLPRLHQDFLDRALPVLEQRQDVVAVAATGSLGAGRLDEHSDLDLLILTDDEALPTDKVRQNDLAAGLGPMLAAFTGEHISEPTLLICLYGPPLLHVDLKFSTLSSLSGRVDRAVTLFDRDGRASARLSTEPDPFPVPDLQWIEDRFWVWVHYAAAKLRRGELMEAKSMVDFVLSTVLGPLALQAAGQKAIGVRRLEKYEVPELAQLAALCVPYDREAIQGAVRGATTLYRDLRERLSNSDLVLRADAEAMSLAYLEES